ncbi:MULTISPECIES: ribulose bisphosphate carboxylase small subunit [Thiomicrorhabdus]|uniref:Ribulose bisphosphate carboxylase small subunit n=1 Tax=Thiomicrorhabdus heinhorstiae TaxID=2748010 RepID=A0ABS0BWM0_9GAMM|nr:MULTISPECIES: ribulose bisphosphate carboxylase small subunit [Thiomicrorhabdus]MBF6058165.1 ribulose bisphosphate carboxylase small subunit [Thiomicrorhabdus heinhorstiae]
MSIQDYPSRISDPMSRKAETFSYLPKMDDDQIKAQVQYIINKGWNPAIEHSEPERATDYFWYMWKLPMFGETDVNVVLEEINNCIAANPNNHVRLIGYDNFSQSQGANMLIKRGDI